MANPLKILTVLTASQAVKMEQGLDVNSQKVTNVADGTVSTDAVAYGQLTAVSGAIKSYVDAQDSALSGAVDTRLTALSGAAATALAAEIAARIAADSALSSSLKTYVDAGNSAQDAATLALSGAIKTYVDAADSVLDGRISSVSGAMKSYVDAANGVQDAAVAAMSGAFKSYIDAENDAQDAATLALSGAIKTYVDAADTVLDGRITSVSGAIKTYVDAQDAALSGAFDARVTALSGAASASLAAEKFAREAGDTQLTALVNMVSQSIVADYIARDGALSSSMKSYVDAANTAQDTATGNLSSSLKSYVDAADTVLSGNIAAEAAARIAEDLTFLKLDGSRTMTGELKMGGQDIVNAKSGSFSGNVTVGGNLQVNGELTYINSTNLQVTDKLVTIAKGAANGAAADGAGLEVDGAGVSFKYDNAAGKWVSDIGLSVANEASFGGAMKLSGSTFAYIATPVASGKYDVNDAIRALDVAVSGAVSAGSADLTSLKSKYDALRCVVTGTLSSGTVTVNLSTEGGAQFVAAQMANLALDVMMNDGTGYTNDLVAIKMFVDGADVKVQIDAPATPSGAFRLIAVNEKDGGLN